jgi:glucose-6-phosphate-specific signal transduction histidine kinase
VLHEIWARAWLLATLMMAVGAWLARHPRRARRGSALFVAGCALFIAQVVWEDCVRFPEFRRIGLACIIVPTAILAFGYASSRRLR